MVNIISNNAASTAKNDTNNPYKEQGNTEPLVNKKEFLPQDILDLSKAAKDAIESYKEYIARAQQVGDDELRETKSGSVFEKSNSQIKAGSEFKAQLAVLEKKSELFQILKGLN